MTCVIVFILLFFPILLYESRKTGITEKNILKAAGITAAGFIPLILGISGLAIIIAIFGIIGSGDGKRPGYPYSARAGQLRAMHTIRNFRR